MVEENKYNNGKIYKLYAINGDVEDIYYGSTYLTLNTRMTKHKNSYKRFQVHNASNVSAYDIFNKYGIENCLIELVELVNCNTKKELLSREGFYIRNNKCVNSQIPDRTKEEYRNQPEYKNKMKIYLKEYVATNSNKLKLKAKDYLIKNKTKISIKQKAYHINHIEQYKEYQKNYLETNRDELLNYKKDYYNKNKDKLLALMNRIIVCECGCASKQTNLKRHQESKKHEKMLASKNLL